MGTRRVMLSTQVRQVGVCGLYSLTFDVRWTICTCLRICIRLVALDRMAKMHIGLQRTSSLPITTSFTGAYVYVDVHFRCWVLTLVSVTDGTRQHVHDRVCFERFGCDFTRWNVRGWKGFDFVETKQCDRLAKDQLYQATLTYFLNFFWETCVLRNIRRS